MCDVIVPRVKKYISKAIIVKTVAGIKGADGTAGTWPLTIYVALTVNDTLLRINCDSDEPVNRVTGFKFQGHGTPHWIIHVQGRGTGTDGKGASGSTTTTSTRSDIRYSSF